MKKYFLLLLLFFYCISLSFSILYLFSGAKIFCERKLISNEISKVQSMVENDKIDVDSLKELFDKNMTTGNNLLIEKAVEDYLIDVVGIESKFNNYKKYLVNTEVTSILDLTILEDFKDELSVIKEELDKFKVENYTLKYTKDSNIKEEFYKFLENKFELDDLKLRYENISASIDKVIAISSFLKTSELYYKIEDSTIVFLKRSSYESYKILVDSINDDYIINLYDYKLVDDNDGPIIDASGVSILVGTNYNFNNNVKCYDEVDDALECKIEGSYDTNKVGSYKMIVEATDLSGNTTTKEIVIKVSEPEKPTGDYYIEIIRNYSTVIVYGLDDSGNYTKIVKVFPASVGAGGNTPLGTYKTTKGAVWGGLYGGVYGQYTTRIVGSILFHSVPYYSTDKSTLWWQEYNNLGIARSMGCVRLTVRDAKWIYDNCKTGTTVKIIDGELPDGVEKPEAPKIDSNSPNRGWDPTDPDPANPWNN